MALSISSSMIVFTLGGKSAIMTALVVGLGGKAATTNRGSSLKGFVKDKCRFIDISNICRSKTIIPVIIIYYFILLFCHTLGRSDCGGEISKEAELMRNIIVFILLFLLWSSPVLWYFLGILSQHRSKTHSVWAKNSTSGHLHILCTGWSHTNLFAKGLSHKPWPKAP